MEPIGFWQTRPKLETILRPIINRLSGDASALQSIEQLVLLYTIVKWDEMRWGVTKQQQPIANQLEAHNLIIYSQHTIEPKYCLCFLTALNLWHQVRSWVNCAELHDLAMLTWSECMMKQELNWIVLKFTDYFAAFNEKCYHQVNAKSPVHGHNLCNCSSVRSKPHRIIITILDHLCHISKLLKVHSRFVWYIMYLT